MKNKDIAEKLARGIFSNGDEPLNKVKRINFRGEKEIDLGGFNEGALCKEIERLMDELDTIKSIKEISDNSSYIKSLVGNDSLPISVRRVYDMYILFKALNRQGDFKYLGSYSGKQIPDLVREAFRSEDT